MDRLGVEDLNDFCPAEVVTVYDADPFLVWQGVKRKIRRPGCIRFPGVVSTKSNPVGGTSVTPSNFLCGLKSTLQSHHPRKMDAPRRPVRPAPGPLASSIARDF